MTSIQQKRQHGKALGRKTVPRLPFTLLPTSDPGLLLAGLLALFIIYPLLQPGLPGTADTPIHFYRTLEFARSWGPGVIYPRWAPDLAYGYGYPLWNFAPPLPYLIPLAFRAAGLSLEASLKGLIVLAALGYALGAYLFVRDSLGPRAGLVAAAVYTLAPFALREVLIYGGNYPQYLAIGLYPWVLWALGRIALPEGVYNQRGRWLNVLLTAAFYGAVILSHLFHALVLTPAALAYAGTLWLGGRRDLRRLGVSALALGLGLLWTAFFWLPALVERVFTRFQEDVFLHTSPFYLRFLNWGELLAWPQALDARAANPWIPFSLGPAALLLAALGLLAFLARQRVSESANWQISKSANQQIGKSANTCPTARAVRPVLSSRTVQDGAGAGRQIGKLARVQGVFFLGLLVVSVFMMLPVSNWVWGDAPLLAAAEFPWRLMGLANLSLAFLGGASVYLFPSRMQTALAFAGVLLVLLSSAVYLYPPRPFVRYGETVADMVDYELGTQAVGTTTLAEYLPRWVESMPTASPLAEAPTQDEPIEKLDRTSLPAGVTAHLVDDTAATGGRRFLEKIYHFDSPQPFRVRFLTFYFPGWTARLDSRPVEIAIEPGSGLITVPVPAGSHELRLQFGDTPLRTASNAITGLTLAALAIAGLWGLTRQPSAIRHPPSAIDSRWSSRPALLVGGGLISLLLIKGLVVDQHTGWFRRESPPDQVIGALCPLRVNLEDRFWLLGYDLDHDTVAQGDTLRVVLYWQAQRPLTTNYRSFVHLDAPTDQRTWAGSDNFHPGDTTAQIDIPTSTWDTAHYVRDEHFLPVSPEVPPVSFNLRVGLYDSDTGQRIPIVGDGDDTIRLQSVRVVPGRTLRQADLPKPVDYRLGDHIRLLGYNWDSDKAMLTLYWQAAGESPLAADYVVFVHLLDEEGRLVWNADALPLGGLYPTSAWQPGAIVADPRPLALADLPPGEYTLVVGMYHPATLARLPVTDTNRQKGQPDDVIRLTRLTLP